MRGADGRGKNNYHSPVQLRELGLSQQMVPNQMKQQLKQRRTVYGQSFFNSPPYPSQQDFVSPEGDIVSKQAPMTDKTRNAQLDSSLRRKRQLPVPLNPKQANKKLKGESEVVQTRNSLQQSFALPVHSLGMQPP